MGRKAAPVMSVPELEKQICKEKMGKKQRSRFDNIDDEMSGLDQVGKRMRKGMAMGNQSYSDCPENLGRAVNRSGSEGYRERERQKTF
jgi:hypothetical protein